MKKQDSGSIFFPCTSTFCYPPCPDKVNHTGLMWENAQSFGAMLVFAEHRFYGQSQFTPGAAGPSSEQFPFLTHEQVRRLPFRISIPVDHAFVSPALSSYSLGHGGLCHFNLSDEGQPHLAQQQSHCLWRSVSEIPLQLRPGSHTHLLSPISLCFISHRRQLWRHAGCLAPAQVSRHLPWRHCRLCTGGCFSWHGTGLRHQHILAGGHTRRHPGWRLSSSVRR